MILLLNILLFAVLIWLSYNILKFAVMVWKIKKRIAALAFYIIALVLVIIPAFTVFLRI